MSLVLPFIWPFIGAFLASVVLTSVTIMLAKKYGLVDDPRRRHHPAALHKKIIPRAGGLPIFVAVAAISLILAGPSKALWGILSGGLILVGVGLVDDKYDLPSGVKLLAQAAAALVVVGFGVGINFVTNPFLLIDPTGLGVGNVLYLDNLRFTFNFLGEHSIVVLADLAALIWIIWVINMVNFSSGVDGQMPGIAFVALVVIFAASLRFLGDSNGPLVATLAMAGAGATLGFLLFNFYPAKIFPGDSGSYFLGFLVAVASILAGVRVGTAILVMAIPLIDGVFTIGRRIASRRSPFAGDRTHLHHRLLALGWGQRRVALFYWVLCAILGAAALSLNPLEKLFAGLVVAIIILGGLLWLNMNLPQKARG